MDNNERTYARLGYVDTYLEIAMDSYKRYIEIKKEIEKIENEGGEFHEGIFVYERMNDHIKAESLITKETIKIVIFLTTFLESYINDLAGIVLGDKYFRDHLDRLSIVSKWFIIPRLITGNEIDKSKSYFATLQDLIKRRNSLIHHKSEDAINYLSEIDEKKEEKLQPLFKQVNIPTLFKMIKELFIDLDRIDKVGYHYSRINMNLKNI
jgi:hypothetical protein